MDTGIKHKGKCHTIWKSVNVQWVCRSQYEQVLFVYILTAILPWLSDPCSFVTVLLVTRELEQTPLLFWSTACSVMPHGLHKANRRWLLVHASFKSVFSLNILTACLFTYSFLCTKLCVNCNIIWHLLDLRMCTCCLFRCRIELNQ